MNVGGMEIEFRVPEGFSRMGSHIKEMVSFQDSGGTRLSVALVGSGRDAEKEAEKCEVILKNAKKAEDIRRVGSKISYSLNAGEMKVGFVQRFVNVGEAMLSVSVMFPGKNKRYAEEVADIVASSIKKA